MGNIDELKKHLGEVRKGKIRYRGSGKKKIKLLYTNTYASEEMIVY